MYFYHKPVLWVHNKTVTLLTIYIHVYVTSGLIDKHYQGNRRGYFFRKSMTE